MTIVRRETRETNIVVAIADAAKAAEAIAEVAPGVTGTSGLPAIDSSVPFLDHMLTTLARYSGLPLTVYARGDLRHHIIEDVAIALGMALRQYIPEAAARYGDRTIPMDDALVQVVLDTGGRPYYRGPIPSSLYDHFMRSLADNAAMTLHIRVLRGVDRHHVVEGAFKGVGLALRDALADSGSGAVFSTKGAVNAELRP